MAANGIKFTFQVVDTPTVESQRHDVILPVDLSNLARNHRGVGALTDRRNKPKLRPLHVGRVVLLTALAQISGQPAKWLHMKHAGTVLVDYHQGAQVSGGTKIEAGIDASTRWESRTHQRRRAMRLDP